MKGKKIIIVLIIINILLIGVIYNFINRNYLNNDKLILKAMTETEYETQIDSLNQTHQNYLDYITVSKTQLATAITNKGVETASTSTFETMATNINNIVTNPSASLISYDNTTSGLASTDVQGAVDELINNLDGAIVSTTTTSGKITIAAEAIVPSANITVVKPSNSSYNWLCVGASTTSSVVGVTSLSTIGSLRLKNFSTASQQTTITWYWIGIKGLIY